MQPTGIQPAQLLMEVMASAKDKIGQEIARIEFSQQLHEQHQLVRQAPLGPSVPTIREPQVSTSTPAAVSCQVPSARRASTNTKLSPPNSPANQETRNPPQLSGSTRDLALSKWRITQNLIFTDPVALDRVLSQYQLAPSVNAAFGDALDGQGQIRLKKFNQILSRVSSGTNDPVPEGRAAAAEIQSLLGSVLEQNQLPAQILDDLAIQSKATYDFGEFRQLMQRFVEQVARTSLKRANQSANSPLPQTPATDAEPIKPAADAPSPARAKLPNHTESLAANLIPSFLREHRGPFEPPHSLPSNPAGTVPTGSGTPRSEATAGDDSGGRELPENHQPSVDQLHSGTVGFGWEDARSATARIEGVGVWPHTLQELTAATISITLAKPSPSNILTVDANAMAELPAAIASDRPIIQIVPGPEPAALDTRQVLLSSVGAMVNASISAAAAFRTLRTGPAATEALPESHMVKQTITTEELPIAAVTTEATGTSSITESLGRLMGSAVFRDGSRPQPSMPAKVASTDAPTNNSNNPLSPAEPHSALNHRQPMSSLDPPVENASLLRPVVFAQAAPLAQVTAVPGSQGGADSPGGSVRLVSSPSRATIPESLAMPTMTADRPAVNSSPATMNDPVLITTEPSRTLGGEPIPKPTHSEARPPDTRPEPLPGSELRGGRDSIASLKTEVAVSFQETGNSEEESLSTALQDTATSFEVLRGKHSVILSEQEGRANYQNSVELLSKGAVANEATTTRPASVTPELAEPATRQTTPETGTREPVTSMRGERAIPGGAPTFEESPSHGQGQGQPHDHSPAWFRNDVPILNLSANPAADPETALFPSYTSSLTAELAQRIQELHRQNQHELTLELQPEHLGRLRIRIGTDDHQVSTLISTESEQIKELLTRSSALLRQELASQGLVLEKLQIDVNSQATAHGQLFDRHGANAQRNGKSRQETTTAQGFPEPAARTSGIGNASHLISLFV